MTHGKVLGGSSFLTGINRRISRSVMKSASTVGYGYTFPARSRAWKKSGEHPMDDKALR
jgi:hypothetical protein